VIPSAPKWFSPPTNVNRPAICHVLHSMKTGGAEVLAADFGRMHREAFDVMYLCLDDAGDLADSLKEEGFEVVVLGRNPGFDYSLPSKLGRILKNKQVDIIHAHQYAPFLYSSLARGILHSRPPIIFTEHGRTFPDYRRPKRCFANKFLLKSSDRVVAVGKQVKEALIKNEGIDPSRIDVIYNGVSVDRFSRKQDQQRRLATRMKEGVSDDMTVIIQVARLNPLKDHITAIRAMRQVVDKIPSSILLIVGEGEERAAIQDEINQLGLSRNVRMLGNRYDVQDLLEASDVFILTSVSEGIPLTVIEAMLSGLPCVATDVGGLSEIIEDGEDGFLVQAKDVLGLASRIVELVSAPEIARRFSEVGRTKTRLNFSSERMHAAYLELYQNMLGR
jgi:N-acetyl-alpha-D-glucosaminyl L-malate synthase BshA